MRHYLVLASGFASSEFYADFGNAYSGLIPLYGEPVLQSVFKEIPAESPVVVTIPTGCDIARHVAATRPGVEIVEVSPNASLAGATEIGLSGALASGCAEVVMLFADTVVHGSLTGDAVGVSPILEGHPFTLVSPEPGGSRLMFTPKCSSGAEGLACVGAFSISDPGTFLACLGASQRTDLGGERSEPGTAQDSGFFAALTRYSEIRPMRTEIVEGWDDAGHRSSWTGLRRRHFETRGFNSLELRHDGYVEKTSRQVEKISQEFEWFAALPSGLAAHCPHVKSCDLGSYLVEYLPSPTLGERVLWGRHSINGIENMVQGCASLLQRMQSTAGGLSSSVQRSLRRRFYVDATASRLEHLQGQPIGCLLDKPFEVNATLVPSLAEIANEMGAVLASAGVLDLDAWSIMHGDFFLGNLIFDSRDEALKMIDPRGSFVDPGVWGDPLYDIAKLSHSLLGGYDAVAAGLFTLADHSANHFDVAVAQFADRDHCAQVGRAIVGDLAERLGVSLSAVRAVEALIFLRMLPLHADSAARQYALVSCAVEARTEALRGRKA